jgi:hypothetical protein
LFLLQQKLPKILQQYYSRGPSQYSLFEGHYIVAEVVEHIDGIDLLGFLGFPQRYDELGYRRDYKDQTHLVPKKE